MVTSNVPSLGALRDRAHGEITRCNAAVIVSKSNSLTLFIYNLSQEPPNFSQGPMANHRTERFYKAARLKPLFLHSVSCELTLSREGCGHVRQVFPMPVFFVHRSDKPETRRRRVSLSSTMNSLSL